MYNKVVIFLCAVGFASAGVLLQAVSPIATYGANLHASETYGSPHLISHEVAPITYTQAYSNPGISTYASSAVITEAQSSHHSVAAAPIVSYSAPIAKAVTHTVYTSISHPAPVSHHALVITKRYAIPYHSAHHGHYTVASHHRSRGHKGGRGDDDDDDDEHDSDEHDSDEDDDEKDD